MSPINSDDLCRMFKQLDINDDGQVSVDELKWLLDRIGVHTSLSELETLVGKQTLDMMDFWIFYDIFIMKRTRTDQRKGEDDDQEEENKLEKDLVNSFKVFDTNGDGFISWEELQRTLSRLGLWEEDCGRDCRSMIEFYDSNGDGLLDFQEFKSMMLVTNS